MDAEDGEEIFQKQMFANVRYFLMSVIKSGDPRFPLSDSLSKTAVTERRALCRFEPNSRQTVCPHWGGRIFAAANCPFPFFLYMYFELSSWLKAPTHFREVALGVRGVGRQRSYRTNKKKCPNPPGKKLTNLTRGFREFFPIL